MSNTVNKHANVAFSITGADESKQDLKKIRDSLEQVGETGKKVAQPITDAFGNIERAADKVNKKISEGRVVTEKDGKVMIQQFDLLKTSIEQAFGSLAHAPADIQQAFKKAEAQVESTAKKIAVATDAVSDQKERLKEGGVAWTGMGDQINKVLGKYGDIQVKGLAVFAALKEGWQIGHQIAEGLGTDFTAFDSALEGVKQKGAQVQSVLHDIWTGGENGAAKLKAAFDLSVAGFEGYKRALEAGIKDIDDFKAHEAELSTIASLNAEIMKDDALGTQLAGRARKEGHGILQDYTASLKLASEIAEAHNKLVKGGAEGQKLWNEIQAAGGKTLLDLRLAVEQHAAAIRAVTATTKEEIAAEEQLQKALNDTTAARTRAIASETQQAELVTNQEKAEDGLTASLRTRLAEIARSLEMSEGRGIPLTKVQIQQAQELLDKTTTLTQKEREHVQALIDKAKAANESNDQQRKAAAAAIEYTLQVNTAYQADAKHKVLIDEKGHVYNQAAKESSALTEETIKITKASGEAADATHKLSGGFKEAGEHSHHAAEGVHGINEGLHEMAAQVKVVQEVKQALKELSDQAHETAAAIQKAASAGTEDTSGGEEKPKK